MEGFWRSELGADPDIVGKSVILDGSPRTVIGVLPTGAAMIERTALYIPLATDENLSPRGANYLGGIARMADGASLEQVRGELATLGARLESELPDMYAERSFGAVSLRDELVGDIRPFILLLLGAVGFVLLIVCANVANLLLAHAATREREFAVRAAMGASRGRIVRQLLVESVMLAAAGCALGYLLGQWGLDVLLRSVPEETPAWLTFGTDWRVVAYMVAVSLAAAILFGLPPALQMSRANIEQTLRETGSRAAGSGRRNRLRDALVISEVAFSLALLVGAGLMVRSFVHLADVDPGFETDSRVMATIPLSPASYGEERQQVAFRRDLIQRLESAPGVTSAGVVSRFPLRGSSNVMTFTAEGQDPEAQRHTPGALTNSASDDYFRVMGIPLFQGRTFQETDRADTPPVVVINEAMARQLWPDESALGKRVKFGSVDSELPWMEIVGVVGGIRHFDLERRPMFQLYRPFDQDPSRRLSVVVQGSAAPSDLMRMLRSEVGAIDPNQALYDLMSLDEVVSNSIWQWKFFSALFWVFGGIAALLAAVGLYGVVSYLVSQRTQEIGIRIALGAKTRNVLAMVARQGLKLIAIGLVAGLLLGLGIGQVMSGLLYEVSGADPIILAGVSALLALVGIVACVVPARRAARVDPVEALRYE
jgi:putative ABC transport system permease protein